MHAMRNVMFIEGEKVWLRPLENADVDGTYPAWFNDQASDTLTNHAIFPRSRDELRAAVEGARNDRNAIILAIIERSTDRHIGNVSLQQIDWVSRSAELAILIGERDAKGRGLGAEAVRLIVDHGFRRMNLNRIWLGVHCDNVPALAIYRKLGFKEEGRLLEHGMRHNEPHDVIVMGLLARERRAGAG